MGSNNITETAQPGGPTLTGSNGVIPANGTSFALLQSAVVISATTDQADTATNSAGGTLTIANINPETGVPTLDFSLPSLGINNVTLTYQQTSNGTLEYSTALNATQSLLVDMRVLDYMAFGEWTVEPTGTTGEATNFGAAISGYTTAPASMPTAGQASYSGAAFGAVQVASGTTHMSASVGGTATVSVNFATGSLTGSLINMNSTPLEGGVVEPWNTVNFTGTISGNSFSGSTSTTLPTGISNPYLLNATSTGNLVGEFFGPSAQDAGAVWSLHQSDNGGGALGTFGVSDGVAPDADGIVAISGGTGSVTVTTLGGGGVQAGTATALPLTQTALTASAADASAAAAGATLTVADSNGVISASSVELKIPNLGVDVTLAPNGSAAATAAGGQSVAISNFGVGSYTAYGQWTVSSSASSNPNTTGWFVTGLQTPAASMPTSGSASYAVSAQGEVFAPAASQNADTTGALSGGVGILTANFASDTVTGSISGMNVTAQGAVSSSAWNSFSIAASISGAAITGSTAATSSPSGSLTLQGTATGAISGNFDGPSANELGAIWTLSDGVKTAIGTVAGAKQTAPSDRRLKRDIQPAGVLANGLRCYRYRYLGDERLFVGVMAQDLLEDVRFANAVVRSPSGLLLVDYERLGLPIGDIPAMREAGFRAIERLQAGAAA